MRIGLHMIDTRQGAYSDDNPKSIKLTEWELPSDGSKRTYSIQHADG
jgi:hypothetical protein